MPDQPPLAQLSSDSHEALYQVSYAHYKQGKYDEAAGLFRFLTMADTANKKYWMGLAASLQQSKRYLEAIEAYELAAALDPADPYVHIHASDCLFGLGKQKDGLYALDCAERAVKLHKEQDPKVLDHIALMRTAWNKPVQQTHKHKK